LQTLPSAAAVVVAAESWQTLAGHLGEPAFAAEMELAVVVAESWKNLPAAASEPAAD